ncbi:hypothetical protein MBLNU230_g5110t1 [Neophaeotheca triangularis]
MSSGRKKRAPCSHENCGSRRFHVGEDGYTYCDEGHQQSEIGTVVAEDTGELIIQGKKSKRRVEEDEAITSTGFTGPRAVEQYLLCLQLVLRKQLKWLIDLQKLPPELEHIVRDIWAIRLQKLQSRVTYDSETDTQAGSSQAFSSQSENESGTETSRSRSRSRGKQKAHHRTPNLPDTLAFCYLGLLLLRSPVTVADLHAWAGKGELLFYRAAREVPPTMRERLPGQYQELLEPQSLLDPQALQQRVLEVATLMQNEFGMTIPPINHHLVLYRWFQELMLPLEVYAVTQKLATLLGVEHRFIVAPRVGLPRVLRYPEAQLMALLLVATKLLFPHDDIERYPRVASDPAALSLDWAVWAASQRKASSTQGNSDTVDSKPLDYSAAFSMQETDCLTASNEKLDAYLDWYSDNIASENVRTQGRIGRDAEFRHALFRFFPVSQNRQHQRNGKNQTFAPTKESEQESENSIEAAQADSRDPLQSVQAALRPRPLVPETSLTSDRVNHVARPGDFYRRYRTVDALHEISNENRCGGDAVLLLYQRAAELCALSLEGMVKAVFAVERKLEKVQKGGEAG